MSVSFRIVLVGLALSIVAACANAPPAQVASVDVSVPPRKPLDAKTQLESGRRY